MRTKRKFAALPNCRYNDKGLQDDEGRVPFYSITDDELTAHFFGEGGRISDVPKTVSLNGLTRVLKPLDKVVTIHIPKDGKLYIEDVKASIIAAEAVFKKYFPPIKAFVCQTWFIDPGLRGEIIKDGSNMAAFADIFDVISGPDNKNHSIFEHIFNVKKQPLENLVPTNDFQKRVLARALRGERIYWGYGVLKKGIL